jgi:hypothetical protein
MTRVKERCGADKRRRRGRRRRGGRRGIGELLQTLRWELLRVGGWCAKEGGGRREEGGGRGEGGGMLCCTPILFYKTKFINMKNASIYDLVKDPPPPPSACASPPRAAPPPPKARGCNRTRPAPSTPPSNSHAPVCSCCARPRLPALQPAGLPLLHHRRSAAANPPLPRCAPPIHRHDVRLFTPAVLFLMISPAHILSQLPSLHAIQLPLPMGQRS